MTDSPLVSVIINCYNSEKYLGETIDSLLSQTYGNWEAIFWDNCSTDRTAEIIKGYDDIRFRYFMADKNTPLGEARNLAMEKVKGELLCFLDSDDVWMNDFLEIGVRSILDDENLAGFYSNYNNWKASVRVENNKGRADGKHDLKFILKNYGIGMSACIVKTSLIQICKIKFDNTFSLVEDLDFFLNVLRYGDFAYCSKPLYDYRITEGNTSHRSKKQWADEYHQLYEKIVISGKSADRFIIQKNDLSRIKYFEVLYLLEYFIETNNRKGMLVYMLNHRIPIRFWSRIIFILLGKEKYDMLRHSR